MPCVELFRPEGSEPLKERYDRRTLLKNLAELALGKQWTHSNQRTDPTALRLRDWYEQADKDIGQYFGEVQTTRARILRQQMNKWLIDKRECLSIAHSQQVIPRIDLVQQVVSAFISQSKCRLQS
jgi:hypothetical protein